MNKVIFTIVFIQSIAILFLINSSNKLQETISTLLNDNLVNTVSLVDIKKAYSAEEFNKTFDDSSNMLSSASQNNQVAQCDTEKLNSVINHLSKQLNERHNNDIQANTTDNTRNTDFYATALNRVTAKVNDILSHGTMSEQDLFLLNQQASHLPKEQRDKLFKNLARNLNQR